MIFKPPSPKVTYPANSIITIFCGGQSNMEGSVNASQVPPALQDPLDGVYTYQYNLGVVQYQAGVNSNISGTNWGPEAEMARLLHAQTGRDIYIIKYAVSGTGIGPDPNEEDWFQPGEVSDKAVLFIRSAVRAMQIAQGKTCAFRALCWMQGEDDCSSATDAANYLNNLTNLMAKLSAQMSPTMARIIGRVSSTFADPTVGGEDVREAQVTYGNLRGNAWIDTDDLPLQADRIHYTPQGLVTLGARFANLVKPYINSNTVFGT